jgi:5-methylcytosine-specific restriction protein A
MATTLTSTQWTEILQDDRLTKPLDLAIFQTLYSFEGYMAYASQVGRILGYSGKVPHGVLNLEVGNYAKRIAKHYDINFTQRSQQKFKYWDLFFEGWDDGKFFVWQLRPELIEALENTGLTGDEPLPDEIPLNEEERLFEGAKRTITVNAYERNSKARELCIKHYGTTCIICGFDFEKKFGEHGKGFIHVHHLTPLADIGEHYEVDPIKDLRPVCPNCHAMLHRDEPPLTIEELKYLLKE